MPTCDFKVNDATGSTGKMDLTNCEVPIGDQLWAMVPKAVPIAGETALLLMGTISLIAIAKHLRIVVGTNDVHVVQSSKRTIAFGKGQPAGNTYYKWSSWLPRLGVQVTQLPVNVFSMALKDYPGYDKGRVPFMIDVIGFFRIADATIAAERLASFDDLKNQLNGILQGAIRSILASSEIEEILEGRSKFGDMFTHAVDEQLKQWGVQSVKTIELMDIRDAQGSQVIANIMAKKKSLIEMQSRVEVAANMQQANIAEVEANRQIGIAQQEAAEQVGKRTAEQEMAVGVAKQTAAQQVKEQEALTATKQMAITQITSVRAAEIARSVQITKADQDKQEAVILAEGEKQQRITRAEAAKQELTLVGEGNLAQAKLAAEGVLAQGTSRAEAERLMLLAPVSTQITLAKEIGENQGYQQYLVTIKQVEASRDVGMEQAKALDKAQIKIIANAGSPADGISSVRELFTSKGGLALGAAIEGLKNTEAGAAIVSTLTSKTNGVEKH